MFEPSYSDLEGDPGSAVALPDATRSDGDLNIGTARFIGDHVGTQVADSDLPGPGGSMLRITGTRLIPFSK